MRVTSGAGVLKQLADHHHIKVLEIHELFDLEGLDVVEETVHKEAPDNGIQQREGVQVTAFAASHPPPLRH